MAHNLLGKRGQDIKDLGACPLFMPRSPRSWISELSGSYHIISRIAGGELILGDQDKEYFLLLLEKHAKGFFIDIHTFCIMGNHFHILATELNEVAQKASYRELIERYQSMYGHKSVFPPMGSHKSDGTIVLDEDDGMDRLRRRLGSISRFTQELKQEFSRWYNKKNERQGYLWSDRFKGVIVGLGEAQLMCSAYIDLNPIRAGIVKKPEDYRWSSMGLSVRDPRRARQLLRPINYDPLLKNEKEAWYRLFIYEAGGIPKYDQANLSPSIVQNVQLIMEKLRLKDKLKYKIKNLSESYAIGTQELIEQVQKIRKHKKIKARNILKGVELYSTRLKSNLVR